MINEQLSYKIRNNVMMIVFCLESIGLAAIVGLTSYLGDFRVIFISISCLLLLSLVFRVLSNESYMWLNRKGRPEECVNTINYICSIQNEDWRVIYLDLKK